MRRNAAQVLKGKPIVVGRPGASMPPVDLRALKEKLKAKHAPFAISDQDTLSAALYPKARALPAPCPPPSRPLPAPCPPSASPLPAPCTRSMLPPCPLPSRSPARPLPAPSLPPARSMLPLCPAPV